MRPAHGTFASRRDGSRRSRARCLLENSRSLDRFAFAGFLRIIFSREGDRDLFSFVPRFAADVVDATRSGRFRLIGSFPDDRSG